mgnify:CR=1 FL=1
MYILTIQPKVQSPAGAHPKQFLVPSIDLESFIKAHLSPDFVIIIDFINVYEK